MKSIMSFTDISVEDFYPLLSRAEKLKALIKSDKCPDVLNGKVVGLLFEKPSTRTRTSFETAAFRLGADPLYMAGAELQLSRGEPIKDTARVLGGYLDAIVARVYSHDTVLQLSRHSGLPTINGLSDLEHPTQLVSDMLTIMEVKGRIEGLNVSYIGDGNNVANSLLLACATGGANATIACPKGYEPNASILANAKRIGSKTGSKIRILNDPHEAAHHADVLYTDVWVSMGQESETRKKMKVFKGYQINGELIRAAKKDVSVMHCLPAHRGLEITEEALEGKHSIAWQQAENKVYGAAAILEMSMNNNSRKRK